MVINEIDVTPGPLGKRQYDMHNIRGVKLSKYSETLGVCLRIRFQGFPATIFLFKLA